MSRSPGSADPASLGVSSRGAVTSEIPRSQIGTWAATEPGREQIAPPPRLPAMDPPSSVPMSRAIMLEAPSSHPRRPLTTAPKQPQDLARESLLIFPRDLRVSVHASGMVLIQSPHGFATRLSAVRSLSYSAGYGTTLLQRRTRGRTVDEPLGSAESPIVEITGKGEIVLGPTDGHRLEAIQLDDEAIYLREDALIGLDLSVPYENGRLAVGDGEAIAMVQLRGAGVVVASLPERTTSIEITEPRSTAIRAISLIGWVGRLTPRTLLSTEAPAGARGFIAFTGEGMVMVDGR
jgi:uncharacterized protein (AIM24 family)